MKSEEKSIRKIVPETFTVHAGEVGNLIENDKTYTYFFCPECKGVNVIPPEEINVGNYEEEEKYLGEFRMFRGLSGKALLNPEITIRRNNNQVRCPWCAEVYLVEE